MVSHERNMKGSDFRGLRQRQATLAMGRTNHSHALAIALTAMAGWVDAIGFLRLGHFFVSFMSGDSTQLAVATLSSKWRDAASAGSIVALFVAGVIVGRLLSQFAKVWGRSVVLLVEALILAVGATAGTPTPAVIVPVVLAMGIQNAAVDKERAPGVGLSYVTGTLVSLGDGVADALRARTSGRRGFWMFHLLHWLGLVLGAACGTLTYSNWQTTALLFPAAIAAILAAITAASTRRKVFG